MTNDNNNVLKQFTRKLANCRYRVPLNSLVKYLEEGQFGYSLDTVKEEIVTNEFVFADDIATVLKHIRAIFKEPHLSLKQESAILNASVATRYDAHSLRDTLKDEKLWRIKGDEIKPEFVHSYVQEDNLAIYENKFLCFLIDTLFKAVTTKIAQLCVGLKTLNTEIGVSLKLDKNAKLTAKNFVDFSNNSQGIPVLISNKDTKVLVIGSLIKSKKILDFLKTQPVYLACKRAGKFNGYDVKPTNIFEGEPHYNYCYIFFKKYFNKEVNIASSEQMYYNFCQINLFGVLCELGFEIGEENDIITVSDSAKIKYSNLVFKKDPFVVTLNQVESGIAVEVYNTVSDNKAKYLFSVEKPIEDNNEYFNSFVLTQNADCEDASFYKVIPSKGNNKSILKYIVGSILLVVEGSQYIHTRYCPVCGSSLLSVNAGDQECVSCSSIYNIFEYEGKDLIWLKRIPNELEQQVSDDEQEKSKSFANPLFNNEDMANGSGFDGNLDDYDIYDLERIIAEASFDDIIDVVNQIISEG